MTRNPLYAFIAFLLVEVAAAAGLINKSDSQNIQDELEMAIGYITLALTALLGLHKYLDTHKHHVTKDAEVQKAAITEDLPVKNIEGDRAVFTEIDGSIDPGTPHSPVEQQIESNSQNQR